MNQPKISVIISTYNQPLWLEKVLWGYHIQTDMDFEMVIADDGSEEATASLIDSIQPQVAFPITHVWQEDHGFQKTKILNKALLACKADYVVMSDGDCIPRNDFLQQHSRYRKKGYFLSGGYFKLPMDISETITRMEVLSGACFHIEWLTKKGLKPSFKNKKLTASGFKARLLNTFTPTKATWNGHNASGWKADMLAINGFDERMQYGGEDREFGERLANYRIKAKQIRYSAICLHLDHSRGYVTAEALEKNAHIRQQTKKQKVVRTPYGIKKQEQGAS